MAEVPPVAVGEVVTGQEGCVRAGGAVTRLLLRLRLVTTPTRGVHAGIITIASVWVANVL
jgi:hypothetical protein